MGPCFLFALSALSVCSVSACGRATRATLEAHGVAGAGAFAAGGAEDGPSEGGASPTGSAGAPDWSVDLDASDCAARPLSDCARVDELYQSTFQHTPALAACEMFRSFDGCGRLTFAFDEQGCVASVAPGPSGWKDSDHLALLQECMTDALQSARFPCLASGTLRYEESCFIR